MGAGAWKPEGRGGSARGGGGSELPPPQFTPTSRHLQSWPILFNRHPSAPIGAHGCAIFGLKGKKHTMLKAPANYEQLQLRL